MHSSLQEIEQVFEQVLEKMDRLQQERMELLNRIDSYEKLTQEKELEIIRFRKEQQRLVEIKEREVMEVSKELEEAKQRIGFLLKRFQEMSLKQGVTT